MKTIYVTFIIICSLTIISFKQKTADKATNLAPPFTAVTLDKDTLNLESLKGTIVVINFWATWCVPCVAEIPALNNLASKYKDKAVFIAVTEDDSLKIKNFLIKKPFSYRQITNRADIPLNYTKAKLKDFNKGLFSKLNVRPITVIINKKGEVTFYQKGGLDSHSFDSMENSINKLLN